MSPDIEAAARASHAALPGVDLPVGEFLAYLDERLLPDLRAEDLQLGDLYLAWACVRRDPVAWKELQERHLSRVPAFVASIDASPAFGDEVRQRLADQLLDDATEGCPGLARYNGRGGLEGFLRVAALGEAQSLRHVPRAGRTALDEEPAALASLASPASLPSLPSLPSPDDLPELSRVKAGYCAAFRQAFEETLGSLPPERRNALRLHYLDGASLAEVGKAYGKSRETAARWVADGRDAILTRLARALSVDLTRGPSSSSSSASGSAEARSFLQCQLDLSLHRHFALGADDTLAEIRKTPV